jgi:hypothetical protein
MIDIFATMVHWCASCVNSGNVIPGAAGIFGGAAGAVGGLGSLTPMSELYPPGTTANPDGSLSWPNPDGTTTTKGPDGTRTTTSPTGSTTTTGPDGTKVTTAPDGTRTVQTPNGYTETTFPDGTQTEQKPDGTTTTTTGAADGPQRIDQVPDLPVPLDPNGNALPGSVGGLVVGVGKVIAEGATELAARSFVIERLGEGTAESGKVALDAAQDQGGEEPSAPGSGEADGGPDHPGEDDPPDATVPDATVGNTGNPDGS